MTNLKMHDQHTSLCAQSVPLASHLYRASWCISVLPPRDHRAFYGHLFTSGNLSAGPLVCFTFRSRFIDLTISAWHLPVVQLLCQKLPVNY